MTNRSNSLSHWLIVCVLLILLTGTVSNIVPANAASLSIPTAQVASNTSGIAPSEFFGVVGRDPWYDFNTDPANPNSTNIASEENMALQISRLGARWIRIEFHADKNPGIQGGVINYAKYDYFINTIAPKYGLKVLALVGSAITAPSSDQDMVVDYTQLNKTADATDGSNPYVRFYANRVNEIADHYGDKIAAFELMNEPNSWFGFKANPEMLGILMVKTYDLVKPRHPNIQLILGATIATGDPLLDHVTYLTSIYNSTPVKNFSSRAIHISANKFPFDGVAWHPYFNSAWDSIYTTDQAIQVMRKAGDNLNKIWVTETGLAGTSNNNNCGGTTFDAKDEDQAGYLNIFFREAARRQQDIATVFWFKYEDFYVDGQLISYGLVHLAATLNYYSTVTSKVVRYKPAYGVFQKLVSPTLPGGKVDITTAQTTSGTPLYFTETGHSISGAFLNYWTGNGGLEKFGYPLTEAYQELNQDDGKFYTVQWFEREKFEYHHENAGTKFEVLLGLLGTEVAARNCKSFSKSASLMTTGVKGKTTPTDRYYFTETGHNLIGKFKTYWDKNGGLAMFGYPISEEFGEINPENGKLYTVQYFERARFEYHPENAGTKYEVILGLLGKQVLKMNYLTP